MSGGEPAILHSYNPELLRCPLVFLNVSGICSFSSVSDRNKLINIMVEFHSAVIPSQPPNIT